jgi:hypothetical protein
MSVYRLLRTEFLTILTAAETTIRCQRHDPLSENLRAVSASEPKKDWANVGTIPQYPPTAAVGDANEKPCAVFAML